MKPLIGIRVGIDACVVSGELFHLVEAMLDRISDGFVAKMPLAREVRGIPVLLEEFGNRWSFGFEVVFIAGGNHDRQCRADRDPPGNKRGTACRAARLPVPTGEDRPFLGKAIDVRRWMAVGSAP